jgi:transcriptional regulator with XRE-family HTH domain
MPGESALGQGPGDRASERDPRGALAELAAVARVSALQPLSPISEGVAAEIREFAETLRVLFGALGVSLNRLAALLHSDAGTVSRYLSGKRIPPPDFIDGLCKAVYDTKGSLVTAEVQELVHEQFLTALREYNPARYEVQRLTDLLRAAAQEKQQFQITAAALEEAIASRNEKIYALELEGRQLRLAWARAEGRLEEEQEQRMRLQETIDSLYTQVSYLKQQLLSAQRRAAEAEGHCRELEARLDAAGALLRNEDQGATAPRETSAVSQSAAAFGAGTAALSSRPGWWHAYDGVMPRWFQLYVGMEDAARSMQVYETQVVPGLLQTDEYAAAVISVDHQQEQTEQLMALRKQRQRRFRDGELELMLVLDEAALRRPIGGTAVHLQQLRYLREVCANPSTLALRVLPYKAGAHVALTGFSILQFAEHDLPDVVYVENLTGALYIDDEAKVGAYMLAIDHLIAVAAAPHQTIGILEQIIAEMETRTDP